MQIYQADKLTDILNNSPKTGMFPDKLKLACMHPMFKQICQPICLLVS